MFLPCAPNPTTGFFFYVPKSKIIDIDMSAEDAATLDHVGRRRPARFRSAEEDRGIGADGNGSGYRERSASEAAGTGGLRRHGFVDGMSVFAKPINRCLVTLSVVMAGLVPAIHALLWMSPRRGYPACAGHDGVWFGRARVTLVQIQLSNSHCSSDMRHRPYCLRRGGAVVACIPAPCERACGTPGARCTLGPDANAVFRN